MLSVSCNTDPSFHHLPLYSVNKLFADHVMMFVYFNIPGNVQHTASTEYRRVQTVNFSLKSCATSGISLATWWATRRPSRTSSLGTTTSTAPWRRRRRASTRAATWRSRPTTPTQCFTQYVNIPVNYTLDGNCVFRDCKYHDNNNCNFYCCSYFYCY